MPFPLPHPLQAPPPCTRECFERAPPVAAGLSAAHRALAQHRVDNALVAIYATCYLPALSDPT